MTESEEPYELRDSRTVLGGARGENPLAYSTKNPEISEEYKLNDSKHLSS